MSFTILKVLNQTPGSRFKLGFHLDKLIKLEIFPILRMDSLTAPDSIESIQMTP